MTCWHKCQVCSLKILRKHRITKKEKEARKNDRERKEWEERKERKMYLQRCFMCIYIFAIVKWNKWRKNLKKSAWMVYVSCIYSKMSVSWIVKVISSVSLFPIPHLPSNFFDYHLSFIKYLFNSHLKNNEATFEKLKSISVSHVSSNSHSQRKITLFLSLNK